MVHRQFSLPIEMRILTSLVRAHPVFPTTVTVSRSVNICGQHVLALGKSPHLVIIHLYVQLTERLYKGFSCLAGRCGPRQGASCSWTQISRTASRRPRRSRSSRGEPPTPSATNTTACFGNRAWGLRAFLLAGRNSIPWVGWQVNAWPSMGYPEVVSQEGAAWLLYTGKMGVPSSPNFPACASTNAERLLVVERSGYIVVGWRVTWHVTSLAQVLAGLEAGVLPEGRACRRRCAGERSGAPRVGRSHTARNIGKAACAGSGCVSG